MLPGRFAGTLSSGGRSTRFALLVIAVLGIAGTGLAGLYSRTRTPLTLAEQLDAAGLDRRWTPRISIATRFRRCAPIRGMGERIPSGVCAHSDPGTPGRGVRKLEQKVDSLADAGAGEAMHAAILLDLQWDTVSTDALTRTVDQLQRLVRGGYRVEDSLADLSAVLLLRAGQSQNATDLWDAVEAADSALDLRPGFEAALFNRALALEELPLNIEAEEAWRAYLAADSTSEYADEARDHLKVLALRNLVIPSLSSPDSAFIAFAAATPQYARDMGWSRLLGAWGEAVLQGRPREARESLHRAEVIGQALEARGRDASLADEVRAIRAHATDTAATRKLASAHHLYGAAMDLYEKVEYARADTLLEAAEAAGADAPLLARWIAAFHAPAHEQDAAAGLRFAESALNGVDAARYPALAGRAYWGRGVIYTKQSRADDAERAYRPASELMRRAGEVENEGAVGIGQLDGRMFGGEAPAQYYSAWRTAVEKVRSSRDAQSLHTALSLLSARLVEDGYSHAAMHVNNELVAVASRMRKDLLIVEARGTRAEGLARRGDARGALSDIAAAEPLLARIEDQRARSYFIQVLRASRAFIEVDSNPAKADSVLTEAIPVVARSRVPVRFAYLLLARADARRALGRIDSARADALQALDLLQKAQAGKSPEAGRSVGPEARAVIARIASAFVAVGRGREALDLIESANASAGEERIPDTVPPGRVVVRYAFVGDSLLTWVISGRSLRDTITYVPATTFRETLGRALRALEQRDDAGPELARLHAWLIAPIEARLGPKQSELVMVTDANVAGVPFATLRDGAGGHYLVEDHVIWENLTVAEAAIPNEPPSSGGPGRVGVVRDPTVDRKLYPNLGQLAGAQAEVDSIPASDRIELAGDGATADALRALLPRVSLLHFAGHAISDPTQPDSSFLVLARGRDVGDLGRLTAAEIGAMHLDHLDLVVLSACRTLRGDEAGSAGFAGLGGAFLGAGAKGVIGSLWRVNDARTQDLMLRFYRHYRESRNGARALREAQLEMLESDSAAVRSPFAWAGFQYIGR